MKFNLKIFDIILAIGIISMLFLARSVMDNTSGPVRFDISTASPPNDLIAKSLVVFSEELEQSLPGYFDVNIFPGSVLVRQNSELNALRRGNIAMATITAFDIADYIPEYRVFNRAYVFQDAEHLEAVFSGEIGKNFSDLLAKKLDLRLLATSYLGTRTLSLTHYRDVNTPSDLNGLFVRMPYGKDFNLMANALGITATNVAMQELYISLKTGLVDGQDNPLPIFFAARFHEVSEQIVLTEHLAQPYFYVIPEKLWIRLTDQEKTALQNAAKYSAAYSTSQRLAQEKEIQAELKLKGVKITKIDKGLFIKKARAFYELTDPLGPAAQDILDKIDRLRH